MVGGHSALVQDRQRMLFSLMVVAPASTREQAWALVEQTEWAPRAAVVAEDLLARRLHPLGFLNPGMAHDEYRGQAMGQGPTRGAKPLCSMGTTQERTCPAFSALPGEVWWT